MSAMFVAQCNMDCVVFVTLCNVRIICSKLASAQCANFASTQGAGKVAFWSDGIEQGLGLEGLIAS